MQLCGHRLPLRGAGGEEELKGTSGSVPSPLLGWTPVSRSQKAQPGREGGRRRPGWRGLGARISCKRTTGIFPLNRKCPRLPASRPGPRNACSGHQSAWESFGVSPLCESPPVYTRVSIHCLCLAQNSERASSGLASRPSDWPLAVLSSQLCLGLHLCSSELGGGRIQFTVAHHVVQSLLKSSVKSIMIQPGQYWFQLDFLKSYLRVPSH